MSELVKEKVRDFLTRKLLRNYILLESHPDFADNTKAIYDELIRREYNKKYKIIWLVKDNKKFRDIKVKNVKFINREGKENKFIRKYYMFFTKYIIDSNVFIYKENKHQFRIHLTHGMFLKLPDFYCKKCGDVDKIITTSDFFIDTVSDLFKVEKKKICITGLPRNDYLFEKNQYFFDKYKNKKYNKIIVWLPTYRNHKTSSARTNINFKYGVPCIQNEEEIKKLNELLKANNTLLLIKLHPAEDRSNIFGINLSNLLLFDDNEFEKEHTNIYKLLSVTDALITDYSSAYYDFLLTKKPIALTVPDIEEYKSSVKLLFEKYEGNLAGDIVYDYDELYSFISNVCKDVDNNYDDRIEKMKKFNKYCDNNSSKRVVDILENRIKE